MDNKIFNKALTDFMNDFATGDAIRHLADRGFTVPEIKERLDFPASLEHIGSCVWEHFLKTGVICLEDPAGKDTFVRYRTIKETDSFGRISFRQVKEEAKNAPKEYLSCDFGTLIRKEAKKLEGLEQRDLDYLLFLPWPAHTVWHVADERMKRISSFIALKA